MVKRLLVSLEISRPHNMLVAAFGVAAGYYLAAGSSYAQIWPATLITAAVTGAGNIINDCFDLQIDKVNKPRRPLPSGRLSLRSAVWLYRVCTVSITVSAVLFLQPSVTVMVILWQMALYGYARWAKKIFVAGNLLVTAVTSSVFLAGALVAGNPEAAAVPIGIAAFFVLSRELVKGAEDVSGDAASGVSTVSVVMGTGSAVVAASGLMLLLVAAIPAPTLAGYYGPPYLWVMELTVVPGLLAASWTLLRYPGKRTFGRVSWLLKIEMFFGVLALGLGRL
jgi:geranylgeranylglycerol-phosphate geranylgeranyltransferase